MALFGTNWPLSLAKARAIFERCALLYQKKTLPEAKKNLLRDKLQELDDALQRKERAKASSLARELENSYPHEESFLQKSFSLCFMVVVVFALATVIRQSWFENYTIPTGSMRPLLREQDRLIVSKTPFAIRLPTTSYHLLFEDQLIERGAITTFSTDGLDIANNDGRYFWIFPFKKRFVKRLYAKGGDRVYFYGGRIYAIDQEGNDISSSLREGTLASIDHVPFLHFEGRATPLRSDSIRVSYQLNLFGKKLATIDYTSLGALPATLHGSSASYKARFGIEHFALARILPAHQVPKEKKKEEAPFYLELAHSPSLERLKKFPDLYPDGTLRLFELTYSYLPLNESRLQQLFSAIDTSRIIIERSHLRLYDNERELRSTHLPSLANIPDGTYEIIHGQAEKVGWLDLPSILAPDHPLNHFSMALAVDLFNYAMLNDPSLTDTGRYAFFRDGDLLIAGIPLFTKDDPLLQTFSANEKANDGFFDRGAPLKDGLIDHEKMERDGYLLPAGEYLLLGDNYPRSGDSRIFGSVPQNNLEGTPSFIYWPLGERFGSLPPPKYPLVTLPRIIVWIVAASFFLLYILYERRKRAHYRYSLRDFLP